MSELKVFNFNGTEVVDSRDVATMVDREHKELLKSIRIYSDYLAEGEIPLGGFFIESNYLDSNNQSRPNYLITQMGCDMIANKTTGKKGVLFTAAYVAAFNSMRKYVANGPRVAPAVSPSGLANLIRITRRTMLDMGSTPQEVGQMVRGMFETWNVPVPACMQKQPQLSGQFNLFEQSKPMIGGSTCAQ